jgi:hypothetical protein
VPENIEYVLIIYGIWIAAFLGYLLWTWNRQHTCQQQLEDLKISQNSASRTVQSDERGFD